MKEKNFTIAAIQINLNNTPEKNLEKCIKWVTKAAKEGAQVVCLPELYSSFYFCQVEDVKNFSFAEPRLGKSYNAFSKLAAELGIAIIVPFFERRMPGIYHNSAYLIDADGSEAGFYRKMHIPDDPGFYEKFYFTPGDLGFNTFNCSFGSIGLLICWDQWFPEAVRILALRGARVVFYPTAIGWHPEEKQEYGEKQLDAWITVQRGHAVANGLFIASVNRVGFEKPFDNCKGIEFWGSSFICGPQGEILARASHDKEEIIYGLIDLPYLENVRQNWPFFRDRRTDAFDDIMNIAVD